MSLQEALMLEVTDMNEEQVHEVLDFAKALKNKNNQKWKEEIERVIDEHLEAFEELAK